MQTAKRNKGDKWRKFHPAYIGKKEFEDKTTNGPGELEGLKTEETFNIK